MIKFENKRQNGRLMQKIGLNDKIISKKTRKKQVKKKIRGSKKHCNQPPHPWPLEPA